jgi:predicted TIM-barrel fold metal-dependent hydrolase
MERNKPANSLSRRSFNRAMTGAAAGVAVAAGISPAAVGSHRMTPRWPAGTYVDFHTHLGQKWGNRPALSAQELLEWMDANGVSQAVVHPLENPEAWDHPIPTNYVLEETAPYRDRLIPAAAIDPRVLNLIGSDDNEFVDLLSRYIDAGARIFGEHKPGIPMDDPRNLELFAACAEVDLPVLFHLDSRRCTDEVGLPGLENVLRQIPDGIFVGHAHGFWASISGDVTEDQFQSYPDSDVAPGGALDRLMSEYPNLYGDLGAGSGANAIARDLEFGREFVIRNADQLVWSSDYLAPGNNVRQLELYPELDLPDDVQQKVFRDNSRELIGLI